MKYQWEEPDVNAGRLVWSHNMAEQYRLCYNPAIDTERYWALVSMRDGMIATFNQSRASIVEHLNSANMRPDSIENI